MQKPAGEKDCSCEEVCKLVRRKQIQTAAEYQVALSQCFEIDSSAVGSVLGLTNQALNTV